MSALNPADQMDLFGRFFFRTFFFTAENIYLVGGDMRSVGKTEDRERERQAWA